VFDDSVSYHLSYDSAQNENPALCFSRSLFSTHLTFEMFKPLRTRKVSVFTIKRFKGFVYAENPRKKKNMKVKRTVYTNE
jgi:hypothetical protein